MAQFRYSGYNFNLTSFYEFLNEFNVKNDEIANQTNLNKAVNQLKRELNQIVGQLKILTSEESIRWNSMIEYQPGEIVSYFSKPDEEHTKEDIENSYYLALPTADGDTNIGFRPNGSPAYWKKIKLEDLYPELYLKNFVTKNQETSDWPAEQDYAVVNIKKLTQKIEEAFKDYRTNTLNKEFVRFSGNTQEQFITKNAWDPASKNYVDKIAKELSETTLNITDKLKNYIQVDSDNKMKTTAQGDSTAIKTPSKGLLPGAPSISNIGAPERLFNTMYATNFHGTALKAKYADIAEVFPSRKTFEPGSILALDPSEKDFVLWNPGYAVFGIVSTDPGVLINSAIEGVKIAHKGLVPVSVNGEAQVGQVLIPDAEGKAKAVDYSPEIQYLGIVFKVEEGKVYARI